MSDTNTTELMGTGSKQIAYLLPEQARRALIAAARVSHPRARIAAIEAATAQARRQHPEMFNLERKS